MITFTLPEIINIVDGSLVEGKSAARDLSVASFSTDTRHIAVGDVFIALKGEKYNANKFLSEAEAKGASVIVCETPELTLDVPQVVVANTRAALAKLANAKRQRYQGVVIAVTGSSGKTTTREMLESIFRCHGRVHSTVKNENNDIGVPLTILAASGNEEVSIIEAGTNHAGEIGYLGEIIEPDVAVVLNVMPAHIGNFDSLEAIAEEKCSLYKYSRNINLVNLNDTRVTTFFNFEEGIKNVGVWYSQNNGPRFDEWCKAQPFGIQEKIKSLDMVVQGWAEQGENCEETLLTISANDMNFKSRLTVKGEHNFRNALMAIATALALGVEREKIIEGVARFVGVNQRMQPFLGKFSSQLIDDTYNANPGSMQAAIDFLATQKHACLVVGDMGELGVNAHEYHIQIGQYAKQKGVERLYACGSFARAYVEGFGENGRAFSSKEALLDYLDQSAETEFKNKTILVKGSRSARMEVVINELKEYEEK